ASCRRGPRRRTGGCAWIRRPGGTRREPPPRPHRCKAGDGSRAKRERRWEKRGAGAAGAREPARSERATVLPPGEPGKAPFVRWVSSCLRACRTLEAYTVQGAGDHCWSPTDRRSFGPGARTESHAADRKREGECHAVPPLAGRGKNALAESTDASKNRYTAGGVVGPRRRGKRLMELDNHHHRRRRERGII